MKITLRQLRQIIKEELMREMPVGIPRMAGFAQDSLMKRKSTSRPPNLGFAESIDVSCGTCVNFCPETQTCMAFNDYQVSADLVCDAWRGE
jgi:hypothetical protein